MVSIDGAEILGDMHSLTTITTQIVQMYEELS